MLSDWKKCFAIIILAILAFVIIMGGVLTMSADADSGMGFEVLYGGTWDTVHIVYDRETGVMYAMSNGVHNMGTMILMVNPDGTPRVYEGFGEP